MLVLRSNKLTPPLRFRSSWKLIVPTVASPVPGAIRAGIVVEVAVHRSAGAADDEIVGGAVRVCARTSNAPPGLTMTIAVVGAGCNPPPPIANVPPLLATMFGLARPPPSCFIVPALTVVVPV